MPARAAVAAHAVQPRRPPSPIHSATLTTRRCAIPPSHRPLHARFSVRPPRVPRAADGGDEGAAVADPAARVPDGVECMGTGIEAACVVADDDEGAPPAARPPSAHAPASVAEWALLVSPFFFWGSSMAAMKAGWMGEGR